jgi:hypothetical protein
LRHRITGLDRRFVARARGADGPVVMSGHAMMVALCLMRMTRGVMMRVPRHGRLCEGGHGDGEYASTHELLHILEICPGALHGRRIRRRSGGTVRRTRS